MADNRGAAKSGATGGGSANANSSESDPSDPTYDFDRDWQKFDQARQRGEGVSFSPNIGSFNAEEEMKRLHGSKPTNTGKTTKWFKCCLL